MLRLFSLEKYKKTKSAIDNGIPIYSFSIKEIRDLGFMNPYIFYGTSFLNIRIFYALTLLSLFVIPNDSGIGIFGMDPHDIKFGYTPQTVLFLSIFALISSGIARVLLFFWKVYVVYPYGIGRDGINNEVKTKIRNAFLFFRGAFIYEETLEIIKIVFWFWGFGICCIILSFVFDNISDLFQGISILVSYGVVLYVLAAVLDMIIIDRITIPKKIAKEVLGYGTYIRFEKYGYKRVREGKPTWFKFFLLDNIVNVIIIYLSLGFF